VSRRAPAWPEGGWLDAVDRRSKAHPWVTDILFALILAAVLGGLSVSAAGSIAVAAPWPAVLWVAFGALHAAVALRRRAPMTAYAVAAVAMLTVVLVPNGRTTDAATGGSVAVPMVFLPSSLVFLVVLAAVAARVPRRQSAVALLVAVAGAVLVTFRVTDGVRNVYPGDWWVGVYVAAALVTTAVATWSLGRFRMVRRRRDAAARSEATRRAVLEERARIARDMHDVVAHSLAVIVRQAEGGAFAAERAPDQATRALRTIAETGRDALADMRGLLGVLRERDDEQDDGGTAPQPGLADLPELLDRVRDAGLKVDFDQDGVPYELGGATELAAYRVVQEALTNTIKHVGPRARVHVRLAWSADELAVTVADDGGAAGPGAAAVPGTGSGLRGLRDRAGAVGGTFTAGRDESGFRVRAALPRRRGGRTEGRTGGRS
jgi:signal transduction histidine kinase